MKSVTILDIYPSVAAFVEKYCKNCNKNCEVPSMEMFGCVLKKFNKVKKQEGGKNETSHSI